MDMSRYYLVLCVKWALQGRFMGGSDLELVEDLAEKRPGPRVS